MARWQPSDSDGDETLVSSSAGHGAAPAAAGRNHPSNPRMRATAAPEAGDTTLLDLLPHPVFAVAVDGDDDFRFIYTNAAYRDLLATDDSGSEPAGEWAIGDLRHVIPANGLVAHVRAFATAARELRTTSFEAEWGTAPPRRVAVDVTPIVGADGACEQLVGAAYDISEHRRIEAELAHRTRHDPLTELPNRVQPASGW
jgi:PAS domain-containing protein